MSISKDIVLINFATQEFAFSQELASRSANKFGIENILSFSDKTIDEFYPEFLIENPWVPTEKRGYGYWLWKPFLLLQLARSLPPETILMYNDCGIVLTEPVDPLIELLKTRDQIFFNMPQHSNSEWTKRDLFIALNADNEEYWHRPQVKAQWNMWRNTQSTIDKLHEWYSIARIKHLIDDSPSEAENLPNFIEHRHDQAILSILVQKWGCEIFKDPTMEGEQWSDRFQNSNYGILAAPVGKVTI